jgi:signal transduction histidine kinase
MQNLIDALVSFSRTSTEEKTMISLNLDSVLREVKATLSEAIAEKGAIIISDKLPVLEVVPFQIQQLLENIISNAIKYCMPGTRPEIRITTGIISGSEIRVTGADPGIQYHQISIADNGIGFEPQYAEKVFELFQRLHNKTEYSGTGIGLAIAKKIVQNHNGFITAESELGHGATFHIYLPALGTGTSIK